MSELPTVNILHVSGSIAEQSVTEDLVHKALQGLMAEAGEHIQVDMSDYRMGQSGNPFAAEVEPGELDKYTDCAVSELLAADIIMLTCPVYNFGVPAGIKMWADVVAQAGRTFEYTAHGSNGLCNPDAQILVASTSGGTGIGGDSDFGYSWLVFFLKFLGFQEKNITLVKASGLMNGGEANFERAVVEAEEWGKALGANGAALSLEN